MKIKRVLTDTERKHWGFSENIKYMISAPKFDYSNVFEVKNGVYQDNVNFENGNGMSGLANFGCSEVGLNILKENGFIEL